jgi:RNA polymerase sigma-70 factor (subfamily 1)
MTVEKEVSGVARELIEKARAGDGQAFSLIVEQSQPRLEALVYLRLGPKLRRLVEVQDVLQETYLRAFQSFSSFTYQGEAALFHWLETVCGRVIQDLGRHFSRKKRKGRAADDRILPAESSRGLANGILDLLPSPLTSPTRMLRREERFDRLEKGLNSLTAEQREVLILARVELLPVSEIASRMGRSAEAVGMLLLRATRKVRAVLDTTESWHLSPERLGGLLAPGSKEAASENGAGGGGASAGSGAPPEERGSQHPQ